MSEYAPVGANYDVSSIGSSRTESSPSDSWFLDL